MDVMNGCFYFVMSVDEEIRKVDDLHFINKIFTNKEDAMYNKRLAEQIYGMDFQVVAIVAIEEVD